MKLVSERHPKQENREGLEGQQKKKKKEKFARRTDNTLVQGVHKMCGRYNRAQL